MSKQKQEYIDILHKMFIQSGEYKLKNKSDEYDFLEKVLWSTEDLYTEENWYRDYPDFKDFLYTHHADSIAYWTSDDFDLIESEDES